MGKPVADYCAIVVHPMGEDRQDPMGETRGQVILQRVRRARETRAQQRGGDPRANANIPTMAGTGGQSQAHTNTPRNRECLITKARPTGAINKPCLFDCPSWLMISALKQDHCLPPTTAISQNKHDFRNVNFL